MGHTRIFFAFLTFRVLFKLRNIFHICQTAKQKSLLFLAIYVNTLTIDRKMTWPMYSMFGCEIRIFSRRPTALHWALLWYKKNQQGKDPCTCRRRLQRRILRGRTMPSVRKPLGVPIINLCCPSNTSTRSFNQQHVYINIL